MGRGKGSRAVVAILAIWLLHDLVVPAGYALDARAAVFAIDQYRAHVSPHLRGIVECRFTPTCSLYGRESIRKHGLARGGVRAIARIARCGPWTPLHTFDPP